MALKWKKDSLKNGRKTDRERIAVLEDRDAEKDIQITELELDGIEKDLAVTELELAVLGLQSRLLPQEGE